MQHGIQWTVCYKGQNPEEYDISIIAASLKALKLGRQCVGLAILQNAASQVQPSSEPSGREDFSLGVNLGSNCAHMHSTAGTHKILIHVLDRGMLVTHAACIIHEDGM